MRRRDDRKPERRLIAAFAGAGVLLFAGTLFVGFAARDIDRKEPPSPVHVSPSAPNSANASG
jgi:hypothetical protein